jgi:hypothetical protein
MNNWWVLLKLTDKTYMVKDNVWDDAKGEGLDSIQELERKLGRKLVFEDFTYYPVNWADDKKVDVYERIGQEGRKELARRWVKKVGSNDDNPFPQTRRIFMFYAKRLLS